MKSSTRLSSFEPLFPQDLPLETPARSRGQGGAPGWTYDLDPGEDRRSFGRRWAWFDPVAKCRVRGCQPCRAASPLEGLDSRAPLVAATSTPSLAASAVPPGVERAALRVAGRRGCHVPTGAREGGPGGAGRAGLAG